MKPLVFSLRAICLLGVATSACRPNVGEPISQIAGPTILAVKAEPAEVDLRPTATNFLVSYEALAVDLGGRVPGPTADIQSPLLWATCLQPKPPTENNSVSSRCLDETALPGAQGTSDTTYAALAPTDACSLFGPSAPPLADPNQPPTRPRDPDVTGGYYLPIRVELQVPANLARAGMSTAGSLISFQLQRIQCGLANAKVGDIRKYAATYTLNNNPALTSLTLQVPGASPVDLPAAPAAGEPIPVPSGQTVSLVANWSPDSVETYPAYDVLDLALKTHYESMRVSWYATSGSFGHDVTGRGENEFDQTFAENTWTPDAPGRLVHMWLVLHDARGGTDFAAFDLQVGP
jgi:hypothetical protein